MKMIGKILLATFIVGSMASCVSKKSLVECQNANRTLQEQLAAAQKRYEDLQKQLHDTELQLASSKTGSTNQQQRITDLQRQLTEKNQALRDMQKLLDKTIMDGGTNIGKLVDEVNSSNKYIRQLVDAKSKSDSLNLALTNKLTRSLSREELKDVEVQVLKGVVYISLNDNMLYKSGSYEISPKASATLAKIAKIITDYKDYEVLVEGNTDDVPIKQTNIRNNWDLSCLRASSVVQELQTKYGVNPKRLTAGGRGEYNPVADNNTNEGRTRNRRTQIIITPELDQFMELIDKAPEE